LDRAVSLAPGNSEIARIREQYDEMHLQTGPRKQADDVKEVKRAAAPAAGRSVAVRQPAAVPEPNATQVDAPAPAPKEVTADDLKKVAVGIGREQLLRFGPPAGRITMDEDSHLIEIFEYSANGTRLGTVRLTDGVVSSVRVP
jgi:hypothetical protein